MTERQILVDELIRDEGLRLKPYMDTAGKTTIGVGRNLSDVGISTSEAMLLLDHDINAAMHDCETFPWFGALDPVRRRVVINMCFNMGLVKLKTFKRTLRMIAQGDYDKAAAAMRNSLWASQVGARADRLIHMMRTGAVA